MPCFVLNGISNKKITSSANCKVQHHSWNTNIPSPYKWDMAKSTTCTRAGNTCILIFNLMPCFILNGISHENGDTSHRQQIAKSTIVVGTQVE